MVGKTSKEKPAESKAALVRYREKRDFSQTSEPSGGQRPKESPASQKGLAFVIQKHAASRLHFDLRLELDGVMKSWAVPKGPSMDPAVKRLAMQVEDHPMEYNTFEGTIPKGQYGGGTVMLWDRGRYTPNEIQSKELDSDTVRRSLREGKLAFTFHGERLNGAFVLVRTRLDKGRAQWLLIKQNDDTITSHRDVVDEVVTSVASGRQMEEIAESGDGAWQSDRNSGDNDRNADSTGSLVDLLRIFEEDDAIKPMMVEESTPPASGSWAIERRYHGLRTFVLLSSELVKLIVPSGFPQESKTGFAAQTSKIERELKKLATAVNGVCVFDGWVTQSGKLVIADVLIANAELVVSQPWLERRRILDDMISVFRTADDARQLGQAWAPESPILLSKERTANDSKEQGQNVPNVPTQKRSGAQTRESQPSKLLFVANSLIVDATEFDDLSDTTGESELVAKRIDATYEGGVSSSWRIVSVK